MERSLPKKIASLGVCPTMQFYKILQNLTNIAPGWSISQLAKQLCTSRSEMGSASCISNSTRMCLGNSRKYLRSYSGGVVPPKGKQYKAPGEGAGILVTHFRGRIGDEIVDAGVRE